MKQNLKKMILTLLTLTLTMTPVQTFAEDFIEDPVDTESCIETEEAPLAISQAANTQGTVMMPDNLTTMKQVTKFITSVSTEESVTDQIYTFYVNSNNRTDFKEKRNAIEVLWDQDPDTYYVVFYAAECGNHKFKKVDTLRKKAKNKDERYDFKNGMHWITGLKDATYYKIIKAEFDRNKDLISVSNTIIGATEGSDYVSGRYAKFDQNFGGSSSLNWYMDIGEVRTQPYTYSRGKAKEWKHPIVVIEHPELFSLEMADGTMTLTALDQSVEGSRYPEGSHWMVIMQTGYEGGGFSYMLRTKILPPDQEPHIDPDLEWQRGTLS